MRVTALEIFDEIITGTTTTWYTAAHLNESLGTPDAYAIQACVSQVSSSAGAPQLTISSQMSGDGNNWLAFGTDLTTGTLVNDATYWTWTDGVFPPHLALVRFKITLTGTSPPPSCRLKLYFTGRSRSGSGRMTA